MGWFAEWRARRERQRRERLRQHDRRTVWADFRYFAVDRDHAILAMTMHMMRFEHWHRPGGKGEYLFNDCLDQAIRETEGWGPCGQHYLPITVPGDRVPNEEGFDHATPVNDAS